MKRTIIKNLSIILVVGLIYFLFLVPMSRLFALLPGTEVRPGSFIPPAAGIYFGMPAAIGVFIGNLFADLVSYKTINLPTLFGSLFNFFMAYIPHRLWYATGRKQLKEDLLIYDSKSLVKYIVILLFSSLTAAMGISLSMLMFAEVSPRDSLVQLFLNNFEFGLIFGVITLTLLPKSKFKPLQPKRVFRSKATSRTAYFFLLLPLVIFMLGLFFGQDFSAADAGLELALISICLALGVMLLPVYQPEINKESEMLKTSIRLRIFIYFIIDVMLITFVLLLIFFGFYSWLESDKMRLWNMTYLAAGISLNLIMLISAIILNSMEKKITVPLYNLARAFHTENSTKASTNEMEVFSSAIDFYSVSMEGEENTTDEYKLYIGLTDKDACKQLISVEEARAILGHICLDYVQGYMADETSGGWLDEGKNKIQENTLVFTIFGATDEQIHSIADESIISLNQEAILIIKNNKQHEFYSGSALQ